MTDTLSLTARLRRRAGALLLGVYVVAAQLAPLAHLASHRDDHTHGPAPHLPATPAAAADRAETPTRGHARALDLATALAGHGRPQWPWSARDDAGAAPTDAPAPAPHRHGPGTPAHTHDEAAAPSPASHEHPPAGDTPSPASRDHAAGSAAHFALAVVDAPPAPVLPVPASSRADVPAPPCRRPHALAPRQVLVRGPPVLA